jgi:putative transposase
VARECGVSKHTIYGWKAKYGGLEVNEAQRLRQLEVENSRLKRLVADLSLDREMLKAVIAKTALARRPEDGCALARRAVPGQRTPGMRADVDRGEQLPLSGEALG